MKADIVLKKELLKGNPGGYYVPAIDKDYNLSFTPTEEDMPAVEPTNISEMTINAFLETDEFKSIEANEERRKGAETSRANAESSRTAAENNRAIAENNRISAEANRANAESSRVNAESARVIAEANRTQVFNTAIGEVETATETANTAAQAASNAVNALVNNAHAGAIVESVEGEFVAVNDASNEPLQGLKLFGKTTQDGTPTPETPVDLVSVGESGNITAWVCGKNLLNSETKNSLGNGSVKWHESDGLLLKGGETYTFSLYDIGFAPNGLYVRSMNEEYIAYVYGKSVITFTPEKDVYAKFEALWNQGQTATVYENAKGQIERGSVATEYESYKPAQTLTTQTPNGLAGIPVSSGGNYTDKNGQQWVCDEVDFERGVYVQRTRKKVFYGTEKWETANSGNQRVFYLQMPDMKTFRDVLCLCSHFIGRTGGMAMAHGVVGKSDVCYFGYDGAANVEEWCAGLATQHAAGTPVTLTYVLIDPIETPLTAEEIAAFRALHTNKPNTTIYNDSNAVMAVDYAADTKIYIDNKIEALTNALVSLGGNI